MSALFNNIPEKDKAIAINDLIGDSTPRPSFFFLVILSVLMATCGLITNNIPVLIASMLIAPLLSPFLSLALGFVIADGKLISRSFFTLLKSSAWAIGISAAVTWFLWNLTTSADTLVTFTPDILERVHPSTIYFLIALIAGAATAFARLQPDLSEVLPGTAIAVALVPPLATIGVGIATLNFTMASEAFFMFVINAVGIIFAAIVLFFLMKLYTEKQMIIRSVERADKELKKILQDSHKK